MKITYAIGDVHGQAEALLQILDLVKQDMLTYPVGTQFRLIQMGDMINRGPNSRKVVEICQSMPKSFPKVEVHVLCGNHEEWTVDLYNGNVEGIFNWLSLEHGKGGGISTLQSYGYEGEINTDKAENILEEMQKFLPKEHIDYFSNLPSHIRDENYLFVHAGIVPGVPLDEQDQRDFITLRDQKRDDFMQSELNHGKIIVHAHTPCEGNEILHNRVNTDGGAGYNVSLKCVVLPEVYDIDEVRVLQVDI